MQKFRCFFLIFSLFRVFIYDLQHELIVPRHELFSAG